MKATIALTNGRIVVYQNVRTITGLLGGDVLEFEMHFGLENVKKDQISSFLVEDDVSANFSY